MSKENSITEKVGKANLANIIKKVQAGKTLTKAELAIVAAHEKEKKLGVAPSMASAASMTGLSSVAVRSAKEAGCTAFFRNGNVDCDALLKFVSENPSIGKEAMSFEEAERRDKQAVAEIREHRLAILRRDYIHVDEVRASYVRKAAEIKSQLLTWPSRLSQKFSLMNDAVEIQEELKREVIELLNRLSKSEWAKKKK